MNTEPFIKLMNLCFSVFGFISKQVFCEPAFDEIVDLVYCLI